jgi:hypothetical protein
MSFSASFSFITCPSCGEPIMPYGTQVGKQPEHLTTTCASCKKVVEMKRDPRTGKMKSKVARPA